MRSPPISPPVPTRVVTECNVTTPQGQQPAPLRWRAWRWSLGRWRAATAGGQPDGEGAGGHHWRSAGWRGCGRPGDGHRGRVRGLTEGEAAVVHDPDALGPAGDLGVVGDQDQGESAFAPEPLQPGDDVVAGGPVPG